MTNLTDPAVLPDPLLAEHPTVEEAPDWRDRGSKSELRTELWHGPHGDFGGMTRFGMGWGPVEVQRVSRTPAVHRDGGEVLIRTLRVLVAGELRYTISVSGDDGAVSAVRVEDDGEVPEYGGRAPDPLPPHRVYLARPATAPGDDREDPPPDTETDERLRALARRVQEALTPHRREKRYLPRDAMNAIDEITRLVGERVS